MEDILVMNLSNAYKKPFSRHNFDFDLKLIIDEFVKIGWIKHDDILVGMEFQSEANYGNAELNIFKLIHTLNKND